MAIKLLSFSEIFESEKPIIGVVHLKALPGSPRFNGSIEEILETAIRDAKALENGGADGVIIENFWDAPFRKYVREPETIVAMTLIVKEIKDAISLPIGVNLLRNSAMEAAAITHFTGGKFIRVNVYIESMITDSGLIEPAAPILLRYLKRINAKIGILADVNVKHAAPLANRDIVDLAHDAFNRGLATAIIITGERTGQPPNYELLKKLKEENIGPILIGSGLSIETIDLLKYADGAIVGTYFKVNGVIRNQVDEKRVSHLINLVKEKFR